MSFFEIDFQFLLLTIFNLQANILTTKDILSNLDPEQRIKDAIGRENYKHQLQSVGAGDQSGALVTRKWSQKVMLFL